MNLFKFEEIKSGFTRQAKQQRSSVFFETNSVNKVQNVYLKTSWVLETEIRLPGY